jgi:hypothetical protein
MRVLPICGRVSDRARLSAVPVVAAARMPSGAYPRFLPHSAAYPRRVLPSCPLAIPFDSPARGRNVHRPPYCCVLPVVTLRVLTAAGYCRSTSNARPASRDLSSLCIPAAPSSRTAYCENCAIRLCRCHGYRAGPRRAVARRRAPSLRRHDLGQVLGNLFALLFSGCAARSSSVQGAAFR